MATCINKRCSTELSEHMKYCFACGKKQKQEPRKTVKRSNGTGSAYKLSGRRRKPWVAAKAGVVIGYYETKTEALNDSPDYTSFFCALAFQFHILLFFVISCA